MLDGLVEKILTTNLTSVMVGGGKPPVYVLFIAFFALLLFKAWTVQYTYNKIFPKLLNNHTSNPPPFKPLTFYEAFLTTFLMNSLFH